MGKEGGSSLGSLNRLLEPPEAADLGGSATIQHQPLSSFPSERCASKGDVEGWKDGLRLTVVVGLGDWKVGAEADADAEAERQVQA